jgi:hypothetical protein
LFGNLYCCLSEPLGYIFCCLGSFQFEQLVDNSSEERNEQGEETEELREDRITDRSYDIVGIYSFEGVVS